MEKITSKNPMKERELRNKLAHCKIYGNESFFEILGLMIDKEGNKKFCRLFEVEVRRNNKIILLTFIEAEYPEI